MTVPDEVPNVEAMKVTVQLAEAPVPTNVQVENTPITPDCDRVTVPVGVIGVPGEMSVTVTVQVDAWLTTTVPVQPIEVDVARLLTTMLVAPLLEL